MSVVQKVYANNATHPFTDTISGYGIFSATQTMPSTTTGATLVAQIKYQTFNTTNLDFGPTTTVNLYSTGGSATGNDWVASVTETTLVLTENS